MYPHNKLRSHIPCHFNAHYITSSVSRCIHVFMVLTPVHIIKTRFNQTCTLKCYNESHYCFECALPFQIDHTTNNLRLGKNTVDSKPKHM